jgi:hypothetical protein
VINLIGGVLRSYTSWVHSLHFDCMFFIVCTLNIFCIFVLINVINLLIFYFQRVFEHHGRLLREAFKLLCGGLDAYCRWGQKILLPFKIHTRTEASMQYRECAFVSVLEEYKGHWKSGHIWNILHSLHILNLCINLSLGGSVSICNSLRAQWNSPSLVCDSSIVHTGLPSSCFIRCYWSNTLRHA